MSGPNIYHLLLALILLLTTTLFLRLLTILPSILPRPPKSPTPQTTPHLMIILGSGGHTAEMLSMLRALPPHTYPQRTYIVSAGDWLSALKAAAFEKELAARHATAPGTYAIETVPRARNIHQSLLTTPATSLYTLCAALRILTCVPGGRGGKPPSSSSSSSDSHASGARSLSTPYPHIILTNGPATGVILVLASLMLKYVNYRGAWTSGRMRTVYIESWARCRTLSLSGRILGWVVDRFLVQWEGLEGVQGGRGEFRGVLVE